MKNPAIKAPVGIVIGLGVTYILGSAWTSLGLSTRDRIGQIYYQLFLQLRCFIMFSASMVELRLRFWQHWSAILPGLAACKLRQGRALHYVAVWPGLNWVNFRWNVALFEIYMPHPAGYKDTCSLGLIDLASYTAISAIFNVCLHIPTGHWLQVTAVCVDWSCCIPIMCNIIWPENVTPGPVYTGRLSRYINIWVGER